MNQSFRFNINRDNAISALFVAIAISWGILGLYTHGALPKLGIQIKLPDAFGMIPFFQPKIFLQEIVMLLLCSLALIHRDKKRISASLFPRGVLSLGAAVVAIFLSGIGYAVWELKDNPINVIRNSCFIWTLIIPICMGLSRIDINHLEIGFRIAATLVFLIFMGSVMLYIFYPNTTRIHWRPEIGVYASLFLFANSSSLLLSNLPWAFTGFAFGLSYYMKFQRTSLVGTLAALIFYLLLKNRWGKALGISSSLVVGLGIGIFLTIALPNLRTKHSGSSLVPYENPLIKSESTRSSPDAFREHLWRDAFALFVAHPLTGIGFNELVVSRYYYGQGKFRPNIGENNFPPISGPHNSYLNAIARMGVAGILLLLIHIYAMLVLIRGQYWGAAGVLGGGMLYSFFNVGLESPFRSFFILLAIGLALKVQAQVSRLPESIGSFSLVLDRLPFYKWFARYSAK